MPENDGYTPPGQRSYAEQERRDIQKIQNEELRKKKMKELEEELEENEEESSSSQGQKREETEYQDSEGNVKEEESGSEVDALDTVKEKISGLRQRKQELEETARGNARTERISQVIGGLQDKRQQLENQVREEVSSSQEGDREAQEQVFGNLAPDQSGYETLQDKKDLAIATSEEGGLPDDEEKLEDLEEFVDGNPAAKNNFNNVEEAVKTKRKAVERENQVDQALQDIKDAPTREERLEKINQRLQNAEKRGETENIELDTSELEAQKERLENSEGLYVIQDGKETPVNTRSSGGATVSVAEQGAGATEGFQDVNREIVSKDELEEELQKQKKDLQKNQEEIDEAFQQSNTTRTVSREERIEEKAEEVDLQEDFVDTDTAYTEAGNQILEAGKTVTAYGETLTGSRGTELLASLVPNQAPGADTTPTEVVEKNIAEDLVEPGSPSPSEQAVDRLSSPPGMIVGFAGAGAGATKGIQAVSRVSATGGKALTGALATAEAVEITRRGFQAGQQFGKGNLEEGIEPLIKLGVEEAGARAGARAVTGTGNTGNVETIRRRDPSGNQVSEDDFPTSEQLPRTGQNTEFEATNTEDVIPTREDIAGTRDTEILFEGRQREIPQETSQIQGRRRRPDEGLEDPTQPLQRGGEEEVFGSREDRAGLRDEGQEDELMSLNEEARQETNLETASNNREPVEEKIIVDEEGNSARFTEETENEALDIEQPQIGNSDVVTEEGFTPEEAEVLADQEQAVGVSGVSETGGLEIQVQAVNDLGRLETIDFSEVASDLAPGGTRKGQLQLQTQESPAQRFDITEDIDLVGEAEEPNFEVTAQGEDFQVTRLDQASQEELQATAVAPLEEETTEQEVITPDNTTEVELEEEPVEPEIQGLEQPEVEIVGTSNEETETVDEEPVVFNPGPDEGFESETANQEDFREETRPGQEIREEVVPEERVVEEEIPVGRQVRMDVFEEIREIRQVRSRFGDPEDPSRASSPEIDLDMGTEFETGDITLDQGTSTRNREDEEEFLPDLLSANTSEQLFGSATFDLSDEETATGRQFTVEQQENLEETQDNFEVNF